MAEQTESNWTESRFRQRLVGASVVVALAVLLLPLWLDGSGIDSLRVQSVPEKPAVEGAEAIDIPQPPGDSGEPLDQPPGALFPDQTPIEARPEGEGESMSQSPDDAAPAATSGTEAGANGAGLRAEPSDRLTSQSSADTREDVVTEAKTDADQASAEEGATASEEAPAVTESADLPESASDGEFVVQLGSFSDERNA
ncbi:MAG TPA: hypothetical protein ENO14_02340, partial [Chromatiales bacterium]|nr:hypothetical protein [Chromatiales bacterium]